MSKQNNNFDLPGTIYSDDDLEIDSDDENLKSKKTTDISSDLGTFFSDFFLIESIGNFNDSLGKAVLNLKKSKKSKGRRKNNKPPKEFKTVNNAPKPLEYELKHDVEEPDQFGEVSKYMNKKEGVELDTIIKEVLSTETDVKEEEESEVVEVCEPKLQSDVENEIKSNFQGNAQNDGSDIMKVRPKEHTKKEKKRQRKAKEIEEELAKDKEELQFEDAPPPNLELRFKDMGLESNLMRAIVKMGYKTPTPIQASTIPIALKGRDICGCAATGTGKTAAFMLPILERLIFKPDKTLVTRVLVLVPTRELGIQVFEVSRELSQFVDVSISLIVGGLNMEKQGSELKKNPDIIIATPGRLIDHIHNTPEFSLAELEILVLDEADRMLDHHFAEQLMEIVRQSCIKRQTMLFSATMTNAVKDLIAVSLQKPVRVFVNNNTELAENLKQEFIRIRKDPERLRPAILAYLASSLIKDENKQCIVFVSLKSDCHDLRILLSLMGVKTDELHGNLKQYQRMKALQKFRDKEVDVLLATDVAARGLDIPGVSLIINYNLPNSYQSYVHRVGRTARAGMTGQSITISSDFGKDHLMLKTIQKNSLNPLYERVISAENLSTFSTKVLALKPSIDKVLELEKHHKQNPTTEKSEKETKKEKKKVEREGKDVKKDVGERKQQPKTAMWNKKHISAEQLEIEIKKREESLRKCSAGIIPVNPSNKKSKQRELKEKTKELRKKGKERSEIKKKNIEASIQDETDKENKENKEDEGQQRPGKRKRPSNFDAELTRTDDKYVKKLRKGPSYLEKKRMFESKNTGSKFTMKGKSSTYTGVDTSKFDNIGSGAQSNKPTSNRAQQKFFNAQEKGGAKKRWDKPKKSSKPDKSTFAGTQAMVDRRMGKNKNKSKKGKRK